MRRKHFGWFDCAHHKFRNADWEKSKKQWGTYPLELYEELLRYVKGKRNYWHALPGEVAEWWRERAHRKLVVENRELKIHPYLEGGAIEKIKLDGQKSIFD